MRFSSFAVKELGRNVTYSQADVLDVTWDIDTGGSQAKALDTKPTKLTFSSFMRSTICHVLHAACCAFVNLS